MKIYGIVFLLLNATFSHAQKAINQIDEFVMHCHENGMFNGSILIAESGQIVYHRSLGFADLEDASPLHANTPFYLASISKQITAMGIMILSEQNKLSYSDKLGNFFPEIPSHFKDITVRHLLNHTSGIVDTYRRLPHQDNMTNADVLATLHDMDSLLFKPGSAFHYSNTGYFLLAMIIEEVSNQSLSKFLTDSVFLPLGMINTFVFDEKDKRRKNRAIGFDRFGARSDYNKLSYGAGGIYSTVEDLFKWSQALKNETLVTQETLQESFKPALSNNGGVINYKRKQEAVAYGFGWVIHNGSLEGVYSHSGGYRGFKNIIVMDRKEDIELIFLTNSGGSCPIFEFKEQIFNILSSKEFQYPKPAAVLAMNREFQKDSTIKLTALYHDLKNNSSSEFTFSESDLTYFGYHLLKENRISEAKSIFKLNIAEYPASWNPYDCYAEACYKNKEYKASLYNYEKSLELNPSNSNAIKMIKRIKEKMAATKPTRQ